MLGWVRILAASRSNCGSVSLSSTLCPLNVYCVDVAVAWSLKKSSLATGVCEGSTLTVTVAGADVAAVGGDGAVGEGVGADEAAVGEVEEGPVCEEAGQAVAGLGDELGHDLLAEHRVTVVAQHARSQDVQLDQMYRVPASS